MSEVSFLESQGVFEKGARHLSDVLQTVEDWRSPNPLLVHWRVKTSETHGVSYLVHDIPMSPPVCCSCPNLLGEDGVTDSLYENMEVEDLTTDPDIATSWTARPEPMWCFSIVYSDVWRVPVIYFTVQLMDGAPCSRDEVVNILRQQSPQNWVADSWDFVSCDEHPMAGTPAFFLHPCRTRERFQVLSANGQWTASMQLWSWMSLIFPSLGFSIPSRTFQFVQKRLLCDAE